MRVAILGVGLIGGSIGLAANENVEDAEVVGFGRSPDKLERARELGAIDVAAGSLEEALEGADACFACGPVGVLPGQVREALAGAAPDCVVTDVGSTKRNVVESTDDERFIGGHPVAGAETSGVEHARADLFQGAVWYLTPGERSSGLLYERLHRLLASFGARPVAIDAKLHDWILAGVSHLPHVLANVLVSLAGDQLNAEGEPLPRVGPSFRDTTRVAGASAAIWSDIFLANRDALLGQLREFGRSLEEVERWLAGGDRDALDRWIAHAAESRRRLLEADLEGGSVHELRMTVPNRPGIVAQVALALGKGDVNIVDMALAPAPDMQSGAMTLWIAGDAQAARAADLIGELGFPVAES
jgi:prephenate dehydrogenase